MNEILEKWRHGDTDALWQHCCGFLDLSTEEFMAIQKRKWKEQMSRLWTCELGKQLLGGKMPKDLEEFRERVPFTTWDDYAPYLEQRREDILPEKPYTWVRTSGVGGRIKWIPITKAMYDVAVDCLFAAYVLSTAKGKGVFSLRHNDIFFCGVAPPPWGSGVAFFGICERFGLRTVPTLEQVKETADLRIRALLGFTAAFGQGLQQMSAIPSVLVKIGETFEQSARSMLRLQEPAMAWRIIRGRIKSKLARRPLLPRDVWNLKSVMCFGADLQAFEKKIEYHWGKRPCEMYVNVEFAGPFAMQTWTRKGMTPTPQVGLLEFIPESEWLKSQADPSYRPSTVLLDEVLTGERYELAFTSFNGGVFVRYRPGDMIRIVAPNDEQAGVNLPQLVFWSRADKLIDIGGFTRLDERTLWLALEDAGVQYDGWIARKELVEEQPWLHVYLATTMPASERSDVEQRLHESLKRLDSSYADLETLVGMKPLRVTFLAPSTFQRYDVERQAAGADPGHMKELHMQPPEDAVRRILEIGRETQETG